MWFAFSALATALCLNEVLYDPPGPDPGREFVELLAVAPVALAGWSLEAGDGARGTWRSIWRASAGDLAAGALFVVGGDSVQAAAARLAGELQNGPDAIRLVDAQGRVHDRAGWGALADPGFFETRPATDVAGRSLARDPDGQDTDDNGRDFVGASPSPGRRNHARRDLGLELVMPDPLRAWPGRALRAALRIDNRGLEEVAGWSVSADWTRVAGADSGLARALAIGGPLGAVLAPGDSTRLVIDCSDAPGLYRLAVRLASEGDEDPTQNATEARVRIGSGDVLVDEIMYAPASGELEWIELRNRGVSPRVVSGYTLTDRSGRRATLRGASVLAPGARGVVAVDTTSRIPGLANTTLRWSATPWPSLNDGGSDDWADALVLHDAQGIVEDACGYTAASRERGRSIERVAPDPDARGVGWAPCTAPSGSTPGELNSIGSLPVAPDVALAVEPNPFSPDGDGSRDRTVVRVVVPPGFDGCRIEIYDLEGRRRARLLSDALGPGPRSVVWEGISEAGSPVEAGAYIVSFECHSKSGGSLRRRRAVGVVRP